MERDEQDGREPTQVELEWRGDTIAEPFTEEEVERNVRKLKEGKAMGTDIIPNEFMKHAGQHTIVRLMQVFNMVRDKEYLVPSWRSTRMTMLHKGGDKELLNNCRGITNNSNVRKLFTRMLTIMLKLDVEERGILGKMQNRFRKGWRSTEAAFTLTHLINKYKMEGKRLAVTILDLKKAYDRVSRVELWRTLESVGYGGKLLRIIQGMYKGLTAKIQLSAITTREIKLEEGLKQGCSLSPVLFALYVAELGDRLMQTNLGVQFGQEQVPAIFFRG